MKALFDPLVIKKQTLATPAEMVAYGKQLGEYDKLRAPIEKTIADLIESYRAKLYGDRVSMLPTEIQVVINKAEKQRTKQ